MTSSTSMITALRCCLIASFMMMVAGVGVWGADSAVPAINPRQHRPLVRSVITRDVVGSSVFLGGEFIEVGINASGSFGAGDAPPAGFHPKDGGAPSLGFVVNPSGYSSATPDPLTTGDFFVPGDPEEMWGVRWTSPSTGVVTLNNSGLNSLVGVIHDDGFPNDVSSGSDKRSVWQGTALNSGAPGEALKITQTVHFDANSQFFVMNVVLTNTGSVTLSGVRYMRSVDPDQESEASGGSGSDTNNYVVFQPPRGALPAFPIGNTDKALVIGEGITFHVPLGLGTIDGRARVAYNTDGNLDNRDPDEILDLTNGKADSARAASPSRGDDAIGLAYDLGDLAPGQSTTLDYAYVLSAADLDAALGSLSQVTILEPSGFASGAAALFEVRTNNPTSATSKVDFFVAGVQVGTSSTPSNAGAYATTFDTTGLSGTVTVLAVATFADGTTSSKSASVVIDNGGPPIAFAGTTPADGSILTGPSAIEVDASDVENPPQRLTIFREVGAVSTVIQAFTPDGFQSTYTVTLAVDDLPSGSSVVLKVVATNANNSSTTITRFYTTPGTPPPPGGPVVSLPAPTIGKSSGTTVVYNAICPSTPEGLARLRSVLAGKPSNQVRAFSWDATTQAYVEFPAEPAGGLDVSSGVFIATRLDLGLDFTGTPSDLRLHHHPQAGLELRRPAAVRHQRFAG